MRPHFVHWLNYTFLFLAVYIGLFSSTQMTAGDNVLDLPPEGKLSTIDLGGGHTLKLTLLPPGEFEMGSPATEIDREKSEIQHHVQITKAFYIAIAPISQGQ